MKIEKIEKVILTEEEVNILNKALNIIDDVCIASDRDAELEKQTNNIITALTDFINKAYLM